MNIGSDKGSEERLAIGRHTLPNPIILAPMSGVTDPVMRGLARRCGAALTVSEMVASDALALGDEEARLRAEAPASGLHVVQLAGREARWMGEAARRAEASGADIIDLNMGCPAKRVTGGWSGSALMRDPDHAERLISATVAAVAVPVTVKMRLGWDDDNLSAPDLARRAERSGAALVTVHGRTRCQFYKGRADWARIRAVRNSVAIPVVANGDVRSLADVRAMLAVSGAKGAMVGRAAQGRPWLPGWLAESLAGGGEAPLPSPAAQLALCLEHYEGLLRLYGRALGLRHARKHLAATMSALEQQVGSGDAGLRQRVLTGETPARVAADLAAFVGGLGRRAA